MVRKIKFLEFYSIIHSVPKTFEEQLQHVSGQGKAVNSECIKFVCTSKKLVDSLFNMVGNKKIYSRNLQIYP